MGQRLIAAVVEGPRGRVYVPATEEMEDRSQVDPKWKPTEIFQQDSLGEPAFLTDSRNGETFSHRDN